jgi:choline dehydrogenase-like flavoprotein
MMLSGIGPADELGALGIDVVRDAPAVGQNLQDHVAVSLEYLRRDHGPFTREIRWDRAALNLLRAHFWGTGPASDLPSAGIGFAKLRASSNVPDIQLTFRAAPIMARPWFPGLIAPVPDAFGVVVILLHPQSRGRVALSSRDPHAAPRVSLNFLASEHDRQVMREGVMFARRIMEQGALAPHRGAEVLPGGEVKSDAALAEFIRRSATTLHHGCGTCRMGSEDGAVVDTELRVRGVEGIRVVDASVMPDLVSGNINATVLMIAERAADLIRGRRPAAEKERARADRAPIAPAALAQP